MLERYIQIWDKMFVVNLEKPTDSFGYDNAEHIDYYGENISNGAMAINRYTEIY
jgi:hypothetical protein